MTKEQEKILDKAYKGARQNAIRKYIPLVIKEALDWNAASLSFLSREIKDWAKELGRELSPREQQALVLAQTKLKQRDVSKTMDSIRRLAQIGQVSAVNLLSNRVLENIEDLADSEVKKTREELENFKTFAKRQAIPKLIEEASFWGERNEKLSVEDAVKTILGDARDTNYTFSSSEKEKLIKANRNVGLEVPRELKE